MKIAIIQPRVSYFIGGGEKIPLVQAEYFAKMGIEVDIYTTKIPPEKQSFLYTELKKKKLCKLMFKEYQIPEKFEYIYKIIPGHSQKRWDVESLYFSELIYQDLKKNNPNIILNYYLLDGMFKPHNIPNILYLLGYPSDSHESRKAMFEFYDSVVSISENVVEKWGEQLSEIQNIQIIHSGVELPGLGDKREIKSTTKNNIVFAGRLVKQKGPQILIKSFAEIYTNNPETTLWILGDGPLKNELKSLAIKLRVSDKIRFVGVVDNPMDYYAIASLVVLPSIEREGLMGTVLEAMAAGKPVITTRGLGNEEIITNGYNGILIEPNDEKSITKEALFLLSKKELRLQMGRNAKKYVEQYLTWQENVKKFSRVFDEVIIK